MKGADNVGLDEFTRTVDGAVDMALSGKVDDSAGTVFGQQSIDQCCLADVAAHENMPFIALQTGEIFQIARISELVKIDDRLVVVRQPVENKVGADKPGASGN
jgi:hypothetical protein